jgi:NAD(P)-dependent dehydrogenase (short-subunit alcohol dehydrogenase family)
LTAALAGIRWFVPVTNLRETKSDDPQRSRQEYATAQPLGRLAESAECAAAALFLASPGGVVHHRGRAPRGRWLHRAVSAERSFLSAGTRLFCESGVVWIGQSAV